MASEIKGSKNLTIIHSADWHVCDDFLKDAQTSIDDILARNKIPILAGGTMMYFNVIYEE